VSQDLESRSQAAEPQGGGPLPDGDRSNESTLLEEYQIKEGNMQIQTKGRLREKRRLANSLSHADRI
jgi:hypothetical protein